MSEPTLNFSIQTRTAQFAVPSELIKKNFKNIQKLVEKSRKSCTEEIARIKKSTLTQDQKLAAVRKLIRTFEALQKKLASAKAADEDYRSRLTHRVKRLDQLKEYTIPTRDSDDKDDRPLDLHNESLMAWFRDETNLLVIDYLIKCNTVRGQNLGLRLMHGLQAECPFDLAKCIDHDVYDSYNRVFLSINDDHDLAPISAWYNENRNALRKINSNLQFEIHFCQYLSMIQHGDPLDAIQYSKTHLAPYARRENYADSELANYEKNVATLTHIGAPLVYVSMFSKKSVVAPSSPLARLLSSVEVSCPAKYEQYNSHLADERWRGLSQCFTEDYTKIYGISQTYPLFVYLSAGISSLKTKSCYQNQQNTIFSPDKAADPSSHLDSSSLRDLALRGPNQYYKLLGKINQCPVCSPELFALSSNLPYAQLITSIFNNPFKLPNGNIYPFDKLLNPVGKFEKDILVRNGKIRDPLTHEIFFIDDCVRVFPA